MAREHQNIHNYLHKLHRADDNLLNTITIVMCSTKSKASNSLSTAVFLVDALLTGNVFPSRIECKIQQNQFFMTTLCIKSIKLKKMLTKIQRPNERISFACLNWPCSKALDQLDISDLRCADYGAPNKPRPAQLRDNHVRMTSSNGEFEIHAFESKEGDRTMKSGELSAKDFEYNECFIRVLPYMVSNSISI